MNEVLGGRMNKKDIEKTDKRYSEIEKILNSLGDKYNVAVYTNQYSYDVNAKDWYKIINLYDSKNHISYDLKIELDDENNINYINVRSGNTYKTLYDYYKDDFDKGVDVFEEIFNNLFGDTVIEETLTEDKKLIPYAEAIEYLESIGINCDSAQDENADIILDLLEDEADNKDEVEFTYELNFKQSTLDRIIEEYYEQVGQDEEDDDAWLDGEDSSDYDISAGLYDEGLYNYDTAVKYLESKGIDTNKDYVKNRLQDGYDDYDEDEDEYYYYGETIKDIVNNVSEKYLKESLNEASNKYEITYDYYNRYGGDIRKATFSANSDLEALLKVLDNCQLYLSREDIYMSDDEKEAARNNEYIDEEDIEAFSYDNPDIVKNIIDEIDSQNGDGCDFIFYIKRPDGSYLFNSGEDFEDDWDESLNESINNLNQFQKDFINEFKDYVSDIDWWDIKDFFDDEYNIDEVIQSAYFDELDANNFSLAGTEYENIENIDPKMDEEIFDKYINVKEVKDAIQKILDEKAKSINGLNESDNSQYCHTLEELFDKWENLDDVKKSGVMFYQFTDEDSENDLTVITSDGEEQVGDKSPSDINWIEEGIEQGYYLLSFPYNARYLIFKDVESIDKYLEDNEGQFKLSIFKYDEDLDEE